MYGQTDFKPTNTKYWIYAGLGVSAINFTKADAGLALSIGLAANYKSNLISVKYHRNIELSFFDNPEEYIWSAEVLYGRRIDFKSHGLFFPFSKDEKNYSFLYSIGLSLTEGSRRKSLIYHDLFDSRYTTEIFRTIGLPVNLELLRRITNNCCLGIGLYTNINKVRMIYGISSSLYIGTF